jgi:hypothetical protein
MPCLFTAIISGIGVFRFEMQMERRKNRTVE